MKQESYIMLTAEDGKILTNGVTFGRIVSLGRGDSAENWREVDESEYAAYLAEEETKAAEALPPEQTEGES